jgi:hypothetical protein
MARLAILIVLVGLPALPAPKVRDEARRTCTGCHSWEVVRVQRLSREGWAAELRKMENMGARIRNREALLDYLSRRFGEQPAASRPPRP